MNGNARRTGAALPGQHANCYDWGLEDSESLASGTAGGCLANGYSVLSCSYPALMKGRRNVEKGCIFRAHTGSGALFVLLLGKGRR
jgi:hypothetical protein